MSAIAEIVGVSEKTIFNYFPTKESMVLDWADEAVESVARMLRERPPNESLTETVLRAMKRDMEMFDTVPDELVEFLPRFGELIDSTPALRAAWGDMYSRIVTVAREELAARAEVDPRDPEPMIAARALTGLSEVAFESRVRWIEEGLRGRELRDAVYADLERAARLLETGLWSFNLLTHGRRTRQQLMDAARAAEDARDQVVKTLRQARSAWRQMRDEGREAMREQQSSASASSRRASAGAGARARGPRPRSGLASRPDTREHGVDELGDEVGLDLRVARQGEQEPVVDGSPDEEEREVEIDISPDLATIDAAPQHGAHGRAAVFHEVDEPLCGRPDRSWPGRRGSDRASPASRLITASWSSRIAIRSSRTWPRSGIGISCTTPRSTCASRASRFGQRR